MLKIPSRSVREVFTFPILYILYFAHISIGIHRRMY